jgi:hypothetical protein
MVSSGSVDAEVKLTYSVKVVLKDHVSPSSTHSFTEWLITLRLLDFGIFFLLSVSVTTEALSTVLNGEVLVLSTGSSAGFGL